MRKILSLILGLLWTLPAFATLPTGYTELEYIESTGTQYIDTQYTMTNTSGIKIVIDDTATNSPRASTAAYFVGSALQGSYMGYFTRVGDNTVVSVWAWNGENVLGTNITSTYSTVYINYMNDRKFIYNNGTRDYVREGDLPTLKDATGNLYLFNTSSGGDVYRGVGKMYSAQITENQSIVRNLVPAQRNSDGAVGMYDTVNDVFYENKGTGSFIAGPEACDGTVVNYVSATGTGVQNGTPTPTNPIEPVFYQQGNMVLRKVGNYADTYDATTGKITRRVAVVVFDGTEDWIVYSSISGLYYSEDAITNNKLNVPSLDIASTHFAATDSSTMENNGTLRFQQGSGTNLVTTHRLYLRNTAAANVTAFKQWLAEQYAAGTPVTVWYPLKTETTEDWTESQYCNANEPIKIATTKYNESAFSPLNTALANAISVVDTVVSNTITQAGRIATLQAQKQTRPNDIADDNEKCPAGKKCLLVEDASGIPHWYEIVERYSRLPDGYTELQWIESTGTQYIDTGVKGNMGVKFDVDFAVSDSSVTNFIVASRAQSGADTRFYLCTFFNSGHGVFDIALGDDKFAGTVQNNTRYTAVMDTNVAPSTLVISDGTTLSSSGNYNTDLNLYVFASNTAGTANFGGKKPITIYKLKIYENNTLVRDFVPAKNADGKIGMYDLVNGVFYENAGEGSFIAGDPVAE